MLSDHYCTLEVYIVLPSIEGNKTVLQSKALLSSQSIFLKNVANFSPKRQRCEVEDKV